MYAAGGAREDKVGGGCGFLGYAWEKSSFSVFFRGFPFLSLVVIRFLAWLLVTMTDHKIASLVETAKTSSNGYDEEDGSLERTRSITKDSQGNTVIRGEDGDVFVIDRKAERELLWKFDLRILPLL